MSHTLPNEETAKPKILFLGEIETAHQSWEDLGRKANFQVRVRFILALFLPLTKTEGHTST